MTANNDLYLQPGEWCVVQTPVRVRTVLGSCVAICLWHPASMRLAITHYLLPEWRAVKGLHPEAHSGRYGVDACKFLESALSLQKIALKDCELSIYGGGDMFPGEKQPHLAIGARNVEWALAWAKQKRLPIKRQDTGGSQCRSLTVDSETGQVRVISYVMGKDG